MRREAPVRLPDCLDSQPAQLALAPAGFESRALGQGFRISIRHPSTTTRSKPKGAGDAGRSRFPLALQQAIAGVQEGQQLPPTSLQRAERLFDRLFEPCRRFSWLGQIVNAQLGPELRTAASICTTWRFSVPGRAAKADEPMLSSPCTACRCC